MSQPPDTASATRPEPDHSHLPDGSAQEGWAETIRTFVYAVLIAMGVRTFAYEPFNIPSGSMIPTLLIGDYLFVSKFSYGYSAHSIAYGVPLFAGRLFGSAPERGDVAVFKLPRDNKTDYIKRLVGVPGDHIQMTKGILHINGTPVKMERLPDVIGTAPNGRPTKVMQFRETLPNGRAHLIYKETFTGPMDNTPVYVVPPGHYFAMGDNRDNSQDSRYLNMVGYVPAENLVGRAEFLFFSLDEQARFWEFWRWPVDLRASRIFSAVR